MTKLVILGIDLETTGLDVAKGDQIIEVGIVKVEYDTVTGDYKSLGKFVQLIDPTVTITAAAQNIHHISIYDVEGKPTWKEIGPKVHKIISQADLIVAHNAQFDIGFLDVEFYRIGLEIPEVEVFCTMENGRFATFEGKIPNLRVLCEAFDIEYDLSKAHGAEYDIILTLKCFFLGIKGGYYKLPTTLLEEDYDKNESADTERESNYVAEIPSALAV